MNQNNLDKKIFDNELGELHPKEINLIKMIRAELRFGSVEIETKDGLPYRVIQRIISKIC